MTECHCEQCSKTPAPTYTRAYAVECLARWVLSLPFESRRAFLVKLEGKHTVAARQALEAEIRKQHKAAQERQKGSRK